MPVLRHALLKMVALLFVGFSCGDREGIAVGLPEDSAPVNQAGDTGSGDGDQATEVPTDQPTETPTDQSTEAPTDQPTETPTDLATDTPSEETDSVQSMDSSTGTTVQELLEVPITFTTDTGWISYDTNDLGVQGSWYTYNDPTSFIVMNVVNSGTVCVTGRVNAPTDGDYVTYFGAKVGFHLCGTLDFYPHTLETCPWSPDIVNRIAGIAFSLSGTLPTTELRLQFHERLRLDGTYVVVGEEVGEQRALIRDAAIHYEPSQPPISVSEVQAIMFYIAPADFATDFAFCIGNIRILATP